MTAMRVMRLPQLEASADRAIDANSARASNRNALDNPAFPSDLI